VALAAVFLPVGVLVVGSAWADSTPSTPPAVKLVGVSPLTEHLVQVKGGSPPTFQAKFMLSVENDSSKPIPYSAPGLGGYKLTVVGDRIYKKGNPKKGQFYAPKLVPSGEPPNLAGVAVTPVPVTLTVHDQDTT
jgi:hypothetical protein